MGNIANKFNDESDRFEQAVSGQLVIPPDFQVTDNNVFSDDKWIFFTDKTTRLMATPDNQMILNWAKFRISKKENVFLKKNQKQKFVPLLTDQMVNEFKIITCLYYRYYQLLGLQEPKPVTIVKKLRMLINFFSFTCSYFKVNTYEDFESLGDINIWHIEEALQHYPYEKKRLKDALGLICNDVVKNNLKFKPITWNKYDLKNIKFGRTVQTVSDKTLPEPVLKFLTNRCCEIIGSFLYAMNLQINDKTIITDKVIDFKTKNPRQSEMFEDYSIRRKYIQENGNHYTSQFTGRFKTKYKCFAEELHNFLYQVQSAAMILVLLYTGNRYSESISIKTGALKKEGEYWVLNSTLIKNQALDKKDNYDKWLAIPIVRDAYRCLSLICEKVNFKDYLFSTIETSTENKPISNQGLNDRLNSFFRIIDTDKRFEHLHLSPHRFRTSLVQELQRADLSLIFITKQLKHAYKAFSLIPSETTMGYGNYKENLYKSVLGTDYSKKEMMAKTYNPGLVPQQQNLNLKESFSGLALGDKEAKQFIKELSKQATKPVSVDFGTCTRNWSDTNEIQRDMPLCIQELNLDGDSYILKNQIIPSLRALLQKAEDKIQSDNSKILYDNYLSLKTSLDYLSELVQEQ